MTAMGREDFRWSGWKYFVYVPSFHIQVLKTLRTAEFKPFIVFVKTRIYDGQRKPLGSSSSLSFGITVSDMKTPPTGNFRIRTNIHVAFSRTAHLKCFHHYVGHAINLNSSLCAGKEEDLQEMKHSADRMDECYGHWVDYVLVKEDPASALAELQLVLERMHMEPQWVPVSWVRH